MKNMSIFLIAVFSAFLLILVWLIKDNFSTEKPLPVFSMSEKILYDKLLLVRRVSPNGNLLLKLLNEKEVFEYDISHKSVAKVDEQIWLKASEKVAVCYPHQAIGEENRVGKYNSHGKYALAAVTSPDKTKIAVVSAYGPKTPSLGLIFGGGDKIWGQRYLEIKENSPNYQTLGKPFRTYDMTSPSLCWAEDGNLLIYFNAWSYLFSVFNLGSEPDVSTPLNQTEQMPPKPDLSKLTGVVRDYGIDENGDGRFEKVAIEVETETSVAGTYNILVRLKSENDKLFVENIPANLKGGIEKTKVLFDTEKWFEEKLNGAFKIEYISLDYEHGVNLDRRENIGQTQKYDFAEFDRKNVVYTNENKITPIDKNGNGKYESLKIEIGVDVLNAGDYEFQGDLYDEFSTVTAEGLIEFGAGKARLNKGAGKITLIFSDKKIVEHGVSGRFRLRNVIIYKKGEKGNFVENLLFTESFDVKEFESEN